MLRGGFARGRCACPEGDLRKRDEELLVFVERFNSLKVALKRKEDELELSKSVEAQCRDPESPVDQL